MLAMATFIVVLSFLANVGKAQDFNCPPYSAPTGCQNIRQSQKCNQYMGFAWDPATAVPTIGPTHCADDPKSNKNCMNTLLSPSTSTSGWCRPVCATNIKTAYFNSPAKCSDLPFNFCAVSVSNCGVNGCDWCAWKNSTNTCYSAFICRRN